MSEAERERVESAISLYTNFSLFFYDWWALRYNCSFLWRCPSRNLLNLYNSFISNNHLDIGVGTGYFMDKCKFSSSHPDITLMDLNPNSLETARKRLSRYDPKVYTGNALEEFKVNDQLFDSVGMMNLLHCLPGDMHTKDLVFENADKVLNKGGVIFGSTILYKGVKCNPVTTAVLEWTNKKGLMTNLNDDVDVLRGNLERRFMESGIEIIGCMALFWGRKS